MLIDDDFKAVRFLDLGDNADVGREADFGGNVFLKPETFLSRANPWAFWNVKCIVTRNSELKILLHLGLGLFNCNRFSLFNSPNVPVP
jgi:hypothetical protein